MEIEPAEINTAGSISTAGSINTASSISTVVTLRRIIFHSRLNFHFTDVEIDVLKEILPLNSKVANSCYMDPLPLPKGKFTKDVLLSPRRFLYLNMIVQFAF